jgi:hypothetical protein
MSRTPLLKFFSLALCLATLTPMLRADILAIGTWVRRPNKDGGSSTMFIETAGTGRKLTFKVPIAGGGITTMIVTTQLDGKDAPVLVDGKPSGETMAIRLMDDRHAVNVIKMNGNELLTQKSELSVDGKVIKVESIPAVSGGQYGTEYWDKK